MSPKKDLTKTAMPANEENVDTGTRVVYLDPVSWKPDDEIGKAGTC